MSKTIVGLFDHYSDAEAAVQDLENAGFSDKDINIVANQNATGYNEADTTTNTGHGRVAHGVGGLVKGAVEGGVIGGATGFAASLAALLVPGIGPVLAAGTLAATLGGAAIGAAGGGIIGGLIGLGIPREQAGVYAEGIRRGGTLVTVQTDEARAGEATDIIERHNPVDIDQRASYYKNSGYKEFDTNAAPYSADDLRTYRSSNPDVYAPAAPAVAAPAAAPAASATNVNQGTTIPVIEEQIEVGKRTVERGGARVRTYVTETPVTENVQLREEHVTVERNKVDRPVSEADRANAFQNRTVEVKETSEEPVVSKNARVVEEVVIGKTATERTETVRDTVRRTDVDVDELDEAEVEERQATRR